MGMFEDVWEPMGTLGIFRYRWGLWGPMGTFGDRWVWYTWSWAPEIVVELGP